MPTIALRTGFKTQYKMTRYTYCFVGKNISKLGDFHCTRIRNG